jgi:hypothetical protein
MKLTFLALTILAATGSVSMTCMADDMTVISKVSTNGQPGGTQTSYISSDHIRHSESKGNDVIIDLKNGTMTNIDTIKKTYFIMTKQDMEAMQAAMAARMNDPKMKQAMAMMQGMSSSMASDTEVKKTGVTRKVVGYACEEWLISMGGMVNMTECVTNDLKYPVQSWAALADFQESMRKSMSFGPSAKSGADYAEKMKSIKGFPVASTTTVDVGITKTPTATEVTDVSRTPIPASTWDVPAGFTKIENPMLRSLRQHGG